MPTFAQVLEKRNEIRYRKTIYEVLIGHLASFVGSDTAEAENTMNHEELGEVPQGLIQAQIDLFQEAIGDLERGMARLDQTEMSDAKDSAQAQSPGKEASKKVRRREGE